MHTEERLETEANILESYSRLQHGKPLSHNPSQLHSLQPLSSVAVLPADSDCHRGYKTRVRAKPSAITQHLQECMNQSDNHNSMYATSNGQLVSF